MIPAGHPEAGNGVDLPPSLGYVRFDSDSLRKQIS
jgi:hypothetical protein